MEKLLKKPNVKKCSFLEYRNWVLVNFLLAVPVRLNTLENIKIKDVDIDSAIINLMVTKNKKPLVLPLCQEICAILKKYIKYRQPKSEDDYLFCGAFGQKTTRGEIYKALEYYNHSRGVQKTGLHIFRNVFAKKWILSGDDVFRLQKILGHSSLKVVKEYLEIYGTDIQKDFGKFSALSQLSVKDFIKL